MQIRQSFVTQKREILKKHTTGNGEGDNLAKKIQPKHGAGLCLQKILMLRCPKMRLSATKVSSDFEYARLASQLGQSNIAFSVLGLGQALLGLGF